MLNYISKYFFTATNNCLSENFAERADVENKTAQTVSLFIGLAAITTAGAIYYFANQIDCRNNKDPYGMRKRR